MLHKHLITLLCATTLTTSSFALTHTVSINTKMLPYAYHNNHMKASAKICYKDLFKPCTDTAVVDAYANVGPSTVFRPACIIGFGDCFEDEFLYSSSPKTITSKPYPTAHVIIMTNQGIYTSDDHLCVADGSTIQINLNYPNKSSCNGQAVRWKWRLYF